MKEQVANWQQQVKDLSSQQVITWAVEKIGCKKLILASSLGLEDQILTHMFLKVSKQIRIFTLDTGRIFQETYDLIEKTQNKYNFTYEIMFPQAKAVEQLVREKGINSFYQSIENRKQCCQIRKMQPLKRILKTVDAWITGLRTLQSSTRIKTQILEWDNSFNIVKLNPLATWSEKDCWNYIKKNDIPYNQLHEKGFSSIGCQPCTRAIEPGEDIRGGRWWWEQSEQKECGLHTVKEQLVSKKIDVY